MNRDTIIKETYESRLSDFIEETNRENKISRRTFIQILGTGLLITVTDGISLGQRRGRSGQSISVAARLHLNTDGSITVLTGKVEEGQGSRTELMQAAAEELRVPIGKIQLVMVKILEPIYHIC